MNKLKMYCICLHDGLYGTIKELGYIPVGLGKENFLDGWLRDNQGENISEKNNRNRYCQFDVLQYCIG